MPNDGRAKERRELRYGRFFDLDLLTLERFTREIEASANTERRQRRSEQRHKEGFTSHD